MLSFHRPKILLAEDEPIVRDLLLTILEECDCDVDAANDGEQAIHFLATAKVPYCLLVTDIQMPVKSGLDVIAWLRKQNQAMPVIVASVEAENYRADELRLGGCYIGLLPKPFSHQALRTMVAEALAPQEQ